MPTRTEFLTLAACTFVLACSVGAMLVHHREGGLAAWSEPSPIPEAVLRSLSVAVAAPTGGDRIYQALDYQCGPCHTEESDNRSLRRLHPSVAWYVIEFPLGMHPRALDLALLGLEAQRLGSSHLFHTAAMASLPPSDAAGFGRFLAELHMPARARPLASLRKDENFQLRIRKSKLLPIESTPTYIVFRHDGTSAITHTTAGIRAFLRL